MDWVQAEKQIRLSLAQNFERDLTNCAEKFNTILKKRTWLSWNYRNWQTKHYLNEHK